MSDNNIGSLLVLDGGTFRGIITERIYARRVALEGKVSRDTRVRDIMDTQVVIARPDWKVEQCLALMTQKRVRHLPVFDGDRLIGIVSIGDLVKSIIDEQRVTIEQLEHYIHG